MTHRIRNFVRAASLPAMKLKRKNGSPGLNRKSHFLSFRSPFIRFFAAIRRNWYYVVLRFRRGHQPREVPSATGQLRRTDCRPLGVDWFDQH
jgi:hypothetical protein